MSPPPESDLETTLLILQATPYCNLSCSYCYLPDRTGRNRMELATVRAALCSLEASGLNRGRVDVAWHSGEPLSLPVAYYEEVFGLVRAMQPPERPYRLGLQTNGIGVNDRFCELFCKFDVKVGLSLDGPAKLHDARRRTLTGGPSHYLTLRGLERLQRWGLRPGVIAVVTRDTLSDPEGFIDFFADLGVQNLNLCFEEVDGANPTSSLRDVELKVLVDWIDAVYRRVAQKPGLRVREFSAALKRLGGLQGHDQLSQPLAAVSVDWRGRFSTFSPELLGTHHPIYGDFSFGSVFEGPMIQALQSSKLQRVLDDIQKGRAACREECSYFEQCGGGVPSNKLAENGRFDSTVTFDCQVRVQAVNDVVAKYC
jgi:uncharacterized protein